MIESREVGKLKKKITHSLEVIYSLAVPYRLCSVGWFWFNITLRAPRRQGFASSVRCEDAPLDLRARKTDMVAITLGSVQRVVPQPCCNFSSVDVGNQIEGHGPAIRANLCGIILLLRPFLFSQSYCQTFNIHIYPAARAPNGFKYLWCLYNI